MMELKEELAEQVGNIFRTRWDERDGYVVPGDDSLRLHNDGINLDATVLYADMSDSTSLVENETKTFAAEIFKSFLLCAAKIIKQEDGTVTAYDGDRVMAVYVGDSKNTSAVRSALKINWAVKNIIAPAMKTVYKTKTYELKQAVGIDTSNLLVARTGVRGANDIVWVGRAANYAAKLSSLREGYPTYITGEVYDKLNNSTKLGGNPSQSMWEERSWTDMNKMRIYRSSWWWAL